MTALRSRVSFSFQTRLAFERSLNFSGRLLRFQRGEALSDRAQTFDRLPAD